MHRYLTLAVVGTFASTACSASTDLADVNLAGSTYNLVEYVLPIGLHYQPPDLCVTLADPPNANSTSLGRASLQFAASDVREHQLRLEHFACSGSLVGDTIYVDQQRSYHVDGERVRIQRPRGSGGFYEDTGYVRRDTLDVTVHQCGDAPCATLLWWRAYIKE